MPPKKAGVKKAAAKPAAKKAVPKAVQRATPAVQGPRQSRRIAGQKALTPAEAAQAVADEVQDADEQNDDVQDADRQDDDTQAEPQMPARKAALRKAPTRKGAAERNPDPDPEAEDDGDDDAPLAQVRAKPTAKGKGKGKQVIRPGQEEDINDDDDDDQPAGEPADEGGSPPPAVGTGVARPAKKRKRRAAANPKKKKKAKTTPAAPVEVDSDFDVTPAGSVEGRQTSGGDRVDKINRRRQNARLQFIQNNPIISEHPVTHEQRQWRLGAKLGAGSFGAAYVCFRTDDNDLIIDRAVFKDMYHHRGSYLNWTSWDGHPGDYDNREHMEIRAMQVLTRAGADKCVRYLGHHNDHVKYFTRVFMDYCPHGSLRDLIYGTGVQDKNGEWEDVPMEAFLPEPAVWKFLEDLTEACLFMAYGSLEESETAAIGEYRKPYDRSDRNAKWRKIVHRDFKPRNIFVQQPHPTDWPACPTLCLGDFGLAIFTNADDKLNPLEYTALVGTKGYRPFEMIPFSDRRTQEYIAPAQLGDATNVWGMGMSILRTMNRQYNAAELQPTYMARDDLEPTFTPETAAQYTDELCNLVRGCVRYKPEDRIDLLELRKQILRRTIPETPDDRADNMRNEPLHPGNQYNRVNYQVDEYRLNMTPPAPAPEQ